MNMLKNYGFKEGDEFVHKDHPNYCKGKIVKIMPKGFGGKSYQIAKCYWTASKNFDFALIKYFALRNLIDREKYITTQH